MGRLSHPLHVLVFRNTLVTMRLSRGLLSDGIGMVERAYSLELSGHEWLRSIADGANQLLGRGAGAVAFTFVAPARRGVSMPALISSGMKRSVETSLVALTRSTPVAVVERTFRRLTGMETASEATAMGATIEDEPSWQRFMHPHGLRDCLVVNVVTDPRGQGLTIGIPLVRVERTPAVAKHVWDRIAVHLGAGLRLRRALDGRDLLDGAEAVVTPGGRIEHAEKEARTPAARERLRAAAVRIERARGRMRRQDPTEALELWQGLVAGRWSLVDHFERSGRRYLVAHRNPPGVDDPRALTERERQIVGYAALGHSNKLVGYELGLSASTVAMALARARAKLGVPTRAALITMVNRLAAGTAP